MTNRYSDFSILLNGKHMYTAWIAIRHLEDTIEILLFCAFIVFIVSGICLFISLVKTDSVHTGKIYQVMIASGAWIMAHLLIATDINNRYYHVSKELLFTALFAMLLYKAMRNGSLFDK